MRTGYYLAALALLMMISGPALAADAGRTVIQGATAGTATCSQPAGAASENRVICYLDGYQNAGAGAQKFAFRVPFSHRPAVLVNSLPRSAVGAAELLLPVGMTVPASGWIILEGF